jgi:arsenite oxidase large subunit
LCRGLGSLRLYADGKFGSKNGKATFMETKWRGLQTAGKDEEKKKFAYLINNGRTNHVWQSAYLDQQNDFVVDRWPYPFIQLNPQDMSELGVRPGDIVEVYNDNGSTQAMA